MIIEARCDACQQRSTETHVKWIDAIAVQLCNDFKKCNKRSGVTK